jgi:hypothetical protein
VVLDDRDALLLGVLELPRRRLEVRARAPRHDADVASAEPARGAAAVHRRVADADDQHALADRAHVPEVHRLEPLDPDVDPIRCIPSPGEIQLLSLRRAAADEDGVEPLAEQGAHARHRRGPANVDPHPENRPDLLVEHGGREPEGRDVGPHQPAGPVELLEDRHRVAERHQVVGDGQRRGPGADERDALPVLRCRNRRQPVAILAAVVGGHALEPADGDGLPVDAPPPAGGLARPVAGPAEDPREDVGLPVEEVRLREPTLGDEPDVLGDVGVRGARPLAVHHLVVVAGRGDVGGPHPVEPPFAHGDGAIIAPGERDGKPEVTRA